MKPFLALGAMLFTLLGCTTVSDLPPGYQLGTQDDEGLAVMSLTLSGKDLGGLDNFEYRVRETAQADGYVELKRSPYFASARQHAQWLQDKDAQGVSTFQTTLIVKDHALAEPLDVIESGKPIGRVAILRLPAGEYELYDWKLVEPSRYGGNAFNPARPFRYRFKIEGGRAVYLGNLDLRVTEQDTSRISIENKAQRDLALLAKKLPSMDIGQVPYRRLDVRP